MKRNRKPFATNRYKATSLQTLIQPSATGSKSARLYQTCDKLMLDIFIDCLLDHSLDLLIIEGTASEQELETTWDKIYVESCQLNQGESYNEILELTRDINDINAKINIVNNIVTHLQLSFDQELVNVLNTFGLRCEVKEEDKGNELTIKLNNVIARAKKWLMVLGQKKRALEEIRGKNTGKTDRAYFDEWLDVMSEQKGYHVESNKITVSRFYRSMSKIRNDAERDEMKYAIKKAS